MERVYLKPKLPNPSIIILLNLQFKRPLIREAPSESSKNMMTICIVSEPMIRNELSEFEFASLHP